MAMKRLDLQRISIEAQAALIARRSNGYELNSNGMERIRKGKAQKRQDGKGKAGQRVETEGTK